MSAKDQVLMVDVDAIDEDPNNARLTFDEAKLKSLGAAMKAEGQLVPCLLRKLGNGYRLIDGARRLRAARLVGIKQLRCEVQVDVDDAAAARMAATVNLQREDLTPYEQARAFKIAIDAGVKKKEICERAGVAFNTLEARLQILELPEVVAQRIGTKGFGVGHAKVFVPLGKHPELLAEAIKVLDDKNLDQDDAELRVRDLPRLIANRLDRAGLGVNVDASGGSSYSWQVTDFDAKLKAMPHIILEGEHSSKVIVTDKAAWEAQTAAWEKRLAEKNAKQQRQRDIARGTAPTTTAKLSKADIEAERRNRLDRLQREERGRLELAAIVGHVSDKTHTGKALWWLTFDDILEFNGENLQDLAPRFKAVAAATGFKSEHVEELVSKDRGDEGDGSEIEGLCKAPAWFNEASQAKQIAFLVTLQAAYRSRSLSKDASAVMTGTTADKIAERALKAAEKSLAAEDAANKKLAKVGPDGEDDDEDGDEGEGDAPPAKPAAKKPIKSSKPAKKPAKASKSKAASKKPSKAVAKPHASLAKAQAKLASQGAAKAAKPAKAKKASPKGKVDDGKARQSTLAVGVPAAGKSDVDVVPVVELPAE